MMEDALKGLTKKQLEDLQERIAKELRECIICGVEGAKPFLVTAPRSTTHSGGVRASLLLCLPCFEKNRLPESRAEGNI